MKIIGVLGFWGILGIRKTFWEMIKAFWEMEFAVQSAKIAQLQQVLLDFGLLQAS